MNMGLGEALRVTLRGSSHGPFVGALVEGLPEGLKVDEERVQAAMNLRKTGGTYSSKRKEADRVEWRTGVVNGITTGEAIEVHIANQDARSSDYSFLPDHPRPGHQDMVMMKRTNGEADLRGGGTSSARMTAPLVAVAAVVRPWLEEHGITVEAHLGAIGTVEAASLRTVHLAGPTTPARRSGVEIRRLRQPWPNWSNQRKSNEIPLVPELT